MGNTDKKKSKKFRRKIRIRLTDPNIPDSYICEILDSSLENEVEEFSKSSNILQHRRHGPSKPRNYFEILMSKNYKKNDLIKTVKEGCRTSASEDDDEEEVYQNRSQKSTLKNKSSVKQLLCTKIKEIKYKYDSSENESFMQNERKNKSENIVVKQENEGDKCLKEENEIENATAILDSPKVCLTRKKTLSILNYFSKTEISQNKNLKCNELQENRAVELKTYQSENSSQCKIKNDFEKQHGNDTKHMLFNNKIDKENVKLAPVFCRKENILDSARQKARLEFLYKGSPSVIKKPETKTVESTFYFPLITHVQQRNESVCWSLRQICLPLQKVCHSECVLNEKKKFSLQIKQAGFVNKAVSEDRIFSSEELLSKIKCKYLGLDLKSIVDGLRDKRNRFLAQEEKIEKLKIHSSKPLKDDQGLEELNTLWTEKYKPQSSEILGNADVVRKLKRWLQSWKSFNDELKVLVNYNQKSKNSSDDDRDDFLDFASENYGLKAPGNVCIVSGPNGCGKTALVYALANELDFNVLELNASSKRTGKKVLSDLQEATQSHKVYGVNLPQYIAVQGQMMKKNIKKRKTHKNKWEPVKINDQTKDCKISLILIEDADIVYDDHDEGFYSAIAALVQTSKRPLIFLTNEPNCFYLENLKTNQCLILEMQTPNFYKSCAVLDVVSCLEGVQFKKEFIEALHRENGFDLRKSLLELQFWIGSGSNIRNVNKVFDLGHLWWGLSKFLFNQDILHFFKCKGIKRKRTKYLFDSSDDEVESIAKKFKADPKGSKDFYSGKGNAVTKITESSIKSYFKVLDLASTLDGFCISENQEPIPGYECRAKDSLALGENMEEVLWGRRLSEELSVTMINLSTRIFSAEFKEEECAERKLNFVSPCWEEIRWRDFQVKASEELSRLISLQKRIDRRNVHMDYLPILRNMCRMERHRSESNPKRKNRFYHYLNNLGPELTEENLETNCEILGQ